MPYAEEDAVIEIEGYDLVDKLAHGNYGSVHLAVQRRLNRFVAMKILDDELSSDGNYLRQFIHEARVAAQLTHPNIVQVYAVGFGITDHVYIAMELIDGKDVLSKMGKGKIEWRQAFEWMLKIAEGLDFGMRKKGMTHGDIKPANIMITANGDVKLTDMGLACMAGEDKTEEQVFTPWYAAPEVIVDTWEIGDSRADMYSFGASLYHMITGRPVFDSDDCDEILDMHLNKAAIDCSTLANIPDDASDFILNLLEKHPDDRFNDWQEIIEKMRSLLKDPSLSKTHSGYHCTRKIIADRERRREALKRLKLRRKRKNSATRRICYGVIFFIVFLTILDFIVINDSQKTIFQKIADIAGAVTE